MALAVALDQNANIEDSSGFFTIQNICRPDDFREIIRLEAPYSDPGIAAEAFYAKLPKSAEIADWLRSRQR